VPIGNGAYFPVSFLNLSNYSYVLGTETDKVRGSSEIDVVNGKCVCGGGEDVCGCLRFISKAKLEEMEQISFFRLNVKSKRAEV